MSDIEKSLNNLGLTKNESKIYISLLRFGSAKAGMLSKQSGINRTTTYDSLKGLLEKGLVSYVIKENRKWFQPVDPQRLVKYFEEKKEDAEELIPQLKKIYKSPEEKQNVTLFYGNRGVKSVFLDIIREGKDNDVFGDEGIFSERMPDFCKFFIKQQDVKKIKTRLISGLNIPKNYSKGTAYGHVKLPVTSPVATNIYGDKIAIIIWSDPPEAVIIKNKAAAESYRSYFNILWNAAKKK